MSDGYELLRSRVGLVRDTHELVMVEGPDASKFLQGLISQDVGKLSPDRAIRSFLLSPQGKLRALLWVFGSSDRIGLIADGGMGERVATDLAHYKIRIKASVSEPTEMSQLIGPDAEQWQGVAAPLGSLSRVFVAEGPSEVTVVEQDDWERVRIEEGEPVMEVDVDERTIPQESGLVDDAVSFTKGCFLGQELVARIDTRGHVNRHLRKVRLQSRVEAPASVRLEGQDVGTMTSIADTDTGQVGLALVHRRVEPGSQVEIAGVPADVLTLRPASGRQESPSSIVHSP